MNLRPLIILLSCAVITILLVVTDNQEYSVNEDSYVREGQQHTGVFYERQSLSDLMDDSDVSLIILAAFSFPFLLTLEATFFPRIRKGWWRLVFVAQGLLFFYLTVLVWFIMIFKLFVEIHVFAAYYFIVIYLGLGVVWNLLLAFPLTNRMKFIAKSFEILSLKRRKTDE